MSQADKLRLIISEQFGGSQTEFGQAIGKSASQVNQWLNGYRNLSSGMAAHIETTLGLPLGTLRDRAKKSTAKPKNYIPEYIELPLYKDVMFYAGEGFVDDVNEYKNGKKLDKNNIKVPSENILDCGANIEESVCVKVSGVGMAPYIPDGSTIAIDKSAITIKDGALHAIYYSGILCIKVLQRMGGNKVKLKSYNPDYEDEIADINDIIVIGRVFWISIWYGL